MRALIVAITSLCVVGCSSLMCNGQMVERAPDQISGKLIEKRYSPYYELERLDEASGLLVRLVITLGQERVPKGYVHTGPFAADLNRSCRDGIVPWVTEVYFINTGHQTLTVEPVRVKSRGEIKLSGATELPAQKLLISKPLVGLHSNYGKETAVSVELVVNGRPLMIEGVAKRLTIDEVKQKYQRK